MSLARRVLVALAAASCASACTTLVAGRKATADGSVVCSHSDDGNGRLDPRVVKVPARDYEEGALRPVYYSPELYPRYVGHAREIPEYYPRPGYEYPEFEPMGYIPQVPHTFEYIEGTYAIMNEHQVGMAESTCSAVFATLSIAQGGKALLSIDQLSQIGLERATTARQAIEIMGSLAEKYGFYGASDSFEGSGETLLVTDPNEGWVFHILPDPTGTSAIWAAQRVPDDEVAVVANMFIIREMNMSDTANFLGSANMWTIAEQHGLWQPGQPQDFTATFSDGEYAHKYYTGRRVWGAYRVLAPSANLSPNYDNLKDDAPYPFSLKPDEKLTVAHFTKVHREWYEGTEYSTSVGLAGGPFGTPDRYSGGAGEQEVQGNWERTIALFRTSQTYVVQSRGWLPNEIGGVVWFGPHAPHGTVFVPFPTGMTALPRGYSNGWQGEFDRSCAFWAHRAVLNLAQIKFSYIIEDIRAKQQHFETRSLDLLAAVEKSAATDREKITATFVENAEDVVREWWRLFDAILFKYADGYINSYDGKKFTSVSVGYPAWWLEQVGYQNGPPPV